MIQVVSDNVEIHNAFIQGCLTDAALGVIILRSAEVRESHRWKFYRQLITVPSLVGPSAHTRGTVNVFAISQVNMASRNSPQDSLIFELDSAGVLSPGLGWIVSTSVAPPRHNNHIRPSLRLSTVVPIEL